MKLSVGVYVLLYILLIHIPCSALANTSFDIWYGSNQSFAQFGEPQRQVNILGNVQDTAGIATLTYSLNNSSDLSLSIGPSPSIPKRLVGEGDFNVEILYADLIEGQNIVKLTATNNLKIVTSETVVVNYTKGDTWPLPFNIDWSTVGNIQDVVQVVDGLWSTDGRSVTTLEPGYDRVIAIGDVSWDNYEVTTMVTVHGVDPMCINDISDCRGGPGVSVLVRWQGHYDWNNGNVQPVTGYFPIGAVGKYKYNRSDLINGRQELEGGEFQVLADDTSRDLPFGSPHIFKVRAETIPTVGHFYSFKMWPAGESEPAEWDLVGQEPLSSSSLSNGSVLLTAHNLDASFGNVSIVPLTPVSGPIAVDDLNGATTYVDTQVTTVNVLLNDTLVDNAVISSFDSQSQNGGDVSYNSDGTFQYFPRIGFIGSDSFDYTLTDKDGENSTATVSITVISSANPVGLFRDNFNSSLLDTGVWASIDPVGDTVISMTGSQLSLSVPAGVEHSVWSNGNLGPRVMQPANNSDFDVIVKFDSLLTGRYQGQGILVEQDENNFIRFDFYQNNTGTTLRIFTGLIENGNPSQQVKTEIANGKPLYLRVTRVGSQWTESYSSDGDNWSIATSFSHSLTVSGVGVFANNYDSNSPAYTVLIDDFLVLGAEENLSPIAVDDSNAATTLEDTQVNTINVLLNDTLVDNAVIGSFDTVSTNRGKVNYNGDGTFLYTPASNFYGLDSFTYTLIDKDGDSSSATITVTVTSVNDGPPLAVDDPKAARTKKDTAVRTKNVLNNDTLVDNAVISAYEQVSVYGGDVVSRDNGTFIYTPSTGFTGTDSFTYTLTDDDAEFSTAKVTIIVGKRNRGNKWSLRY